MWECKNCHAINGLALKVCQKCGAKREG